MSEREKTENREGLGEAKYRCEEGQAHSHECTCTPAGTGR